LRNEIGQSRTAYQEAATVNDCRVRHALFALWAVFSTTDHVYEGRGNNPKLPKVAEVLL